MAKQFGGLTKFSSDYIGTGTVDSAFPLYGIVATDHRLNFVPHHPSSLEPIITTALNLLPLLLLAGLFFLMLRQAQGSNNQALSFGKSRARMFAGNRPTVTFADVAGVEEAEAGACRSGGISEVSG